MPPENFSAPACPSTVSVSGNEFGVNIAMRSGAINCSFMECKCVVST